MIEFANPLILLLIPLYLIILFAFSLFPKKKATLSFPIPIDFSRGKQKVISLSDRTFSLMKLIAVVLLITALARPQSVIRTTVPPTAGIDIMLTVDTSPSMAAMDFAPYTRLIAAKETAREFVKKRVNDRIGVITFGGTAYMVCPVTYDHAAVLDSLRSLDIHMTRVAGTAIGDAIATSVNHLKNSKAKSKIIVLLTDGRSNVGVITDPFMAARLALTENIKIYTIGTATVNSIMQGEDLDEPTLRGIAGLTGGQFYHATSISDLREIYASINSLEKTEMKDQTYVIKYDKYKPLLYLALLLLLLEFCVRKIVFLRIP